MRCATTSAPPPSSAPRFRLHPLLFAILADVAGEGAGLEAWEKANEVPARSGKVLLRIALEPVADFDELRSGLVGAER